MSTELMFKRLVSYSCFLILQNFEGRLPLLSLKSRVSDGMLANVWTENREDTGEIRYKSWAKLDRDPLRLTSYN